MAGRSKSRTIRVQALARVEGEGALYARVRDGRVVELRLIIYEPPRFFEAFLRGRRYDEPVDITARICGICPVAYQMSACNAIESVLGVRVPEEIRPLRLLLYYGEWIESHALHVFLLHLPDFLGYASALDMARDHAEWIETGLAIKKTGNQILECIGGRSVHPINVRVGGFYRAPSPEDIRALREPLLRARDRVITAVRFFARLDYPDFEREYTFVALRHPQEYAILDGRIVSNRGLDIPVSDFEMVFEEYPVTYSNALHAVIRGQGPYMVGPMARFNLNFPQLVPIAREVAREVGITPPVRNPFRSILVRCIEMLHACESALRIVENYTPPARPAVDVIPRPGVGCGASEAPRGLLYHRYRIDPEGRIAEARIVPPTSQNQACIETDLERWIPRILHLPRARMVEQCEQAIRNYDPCISCATHFLRVHIEEA